MLNYVAITLMLILTFSCGTGGRRSSNSFTVNIDALSRNVNLDDAVIYILSNDEKPKTLVDEEYDEYVGNLIRLNGAEVTRNPAEANYFLYHEYLFSVNEAIDLKSIQVPVYRPGTSFTIRAQDASALQVHQSGQWGSESRLVSEKTRKSTRAIRLFLYDKDGNNISELYLNSIGRSTNKREVYPVILAAGAEFFGTHSRKTATVVIDQNSALVNAIKTGEGVKGEISRRAYREAPANIIKREGYCSPIERILNRCR